MRQFLLSLAVILFAPVIAHAEVMTVASPKCDAGKIKAIGGAAISQVDKGEWDGGYKVTLDSAQISQADFTRKLMGAGCF